MKHSAKHEEPSAPSAEAGSVSSRPAGVQASQAVPVARGAVRADTAVPVAVAAVAVT